MPTIILELRKVRKVSASSVVAEHLHAGGVAVEDTTSYHKGTHAQINDTAGEKDAS